MFSCRLRGLEAGKLDDDVFEDEYPLGAENQNLYLTFNSLRYMCLKLSSNYMYEYICECVFECVFVHFLLVSDREQN